MAISKLIMNRNVPAKASVRIKGTLNAMPPPIVHLNIIRSENSQIKDYLQKFLILFNSNEQPLSDHPSSAAPDPLSELHVLEHDEIW